MKAKLIFSLPEEQEDFELALKAQSMSIVLEEITNRIFRPARKHGYPDGELADLLEALNKCPGLEGYPGIKLIGLLETMFHELLKEYDL